MSGPDKEKGDPFSNRSPSEIAKLLRQEWSARALSPRAPFYIASHPNWRDKDAWEEQARIDVSFLLTGIDEAWLNQSEILEIGCGTGRLVPSIAPRVKSYLGFDICPEFVQQADALSKTFANSEIVVSDGAGLPRECAGRAFDLVFAAAVFIHCPKVIIERYLSQVKAVMSNSGSFRFQVLTDPEDCSEIMPLHLLDPEAHEAGKKAIDAVSQEQREAEEAELVEESNYQGHRFSIEELRETIERHYPHPSVVHIIRFDPLIANCEIIYHET